MSDGPRAANRTSLLCPWAILAVMALSLFVIAQGVIGALDSNANDPRQWLPRGYDEAKTYQWLQDHFGQDEITIVSWPGCNLTDERIARLKTALLDPRDEGYYSRAITGPEMFQQLCERPLFLSGREAFYRLRGTLIGDDGTTCLVLFISEKGVEDRTAAVNYVIETAQRECGLDRDALRLAGPTVDAATIDVESQRLLLPLAGISAVVAFALAWWLLGRFRLAVIVLAGAIYATGVTLTILYYTGGSMNLLMTMLPPLVYLLSISSAVHLVNYYRDAVAEVGPQAAPRTALIQGCRPCLLASATTAVGLASLAVSTIVPIEMFGIYSAVGMIVGLIVTLAYLPAALALWPLPDSRPTDGQTPAERSSDLIDRATRFICRWHAPLTIGGILLMVGSGLGVFLLESTVRLQYRFPAESLIIRDYTWLEENLGPLVPLEVVLHFDDDCPLDILEQMELVAEAEEAIKARPEVGATMSAVDFAPPLPQGTRIVDVGLRTILRERLLASRHRYVDAHFLADGENENGQPEELWRISVRADALGNVDYGRFVDTLQACVAPVLAANDRGGVRATYTGVIPLIYKAQRELLNDLAKSFLLAFGAIAVVMVVILASPPAGMLAMIPNAFPAVVVFGLMGLCTLKIEIGSVMTASAALGIAVDDTFHYLTWFRRGIRDGMSRRRALKFAYRRCAGAMLCTTLICGAGLLVFSLSSFMPIVRFARLMATLLAAALIGDLILLPAMLAGPLGRVFARRAKRE